MTVHHVTELSLNGVNLLDRIQPRSMLEFVSTFPWGRYATIASQSLMIRIPYGFRSCPVSNGNDLVFVSCSGVFGRISCLFGFEYQMKIEVIPAR